MINDSGLVKRIDPIRSDLKNYLLGHLHDDGLIRGELSSSALSTAVSVFTLFLHDEKKHGKKIKKAVLWLKDTVNKDNGWGDTPRSNSNLSTTILCLSALVTIDSKTDPLIEKALTWVKDQTGGLSPENISSAVKEIYGKDLTFCAPILTMAALSDFFDNDVP